MKLLPLLPTIVALIASNAVVNAIPIDVSDSGLAAREPSLDSLLEADLLERDFFADDLAERDFEELEVRGNSKSKPKDPERKAKYPTGNPKPETPKGEIRQFTAGRKDDYFGDWQTVVNGVDNPAAGKGKKTKKRSFDDFEDLEARGNGFSKPKDPERKAKYPTGNPRPETPKGEIRQFTAGRKDDYFGDWKTVVNGVDNPAAGKGKKTKKRSFDDFEDLEARGNGFSKPKDPERKAKYPTGNPRPETPKGEIRQFTAGRKDDYFGDWKTVVNGVDNPAAGKGKKTKKRSFDDFEDLEARGNGFSKPKDPERKAKYPTGNPRPETPKGEIRQFTAGRKDDYFGDWQTVVNGVDNPAAGKGKKSKKRELESFYDELD